MTTDKRGQQIHEAIAGGDAAALRRMAASDAREEGRMWLTLLARMLELDAGRRRGQQTRPSALVALPRMPRAAMRRAV